MRTILITGATGYIGANLVRGFLGEQSRVHVLVRPGSDLGALLSVRESISVHAHDGTTDGLIAVMKSVSPGTVFHLAARVVAEHRSKDVEPLILANVLFGTQLLEAAVAAEVPCFVNTGTFWQHYEGERYNPVCLYSATKQAFEDILCYYVEAHQLRAMTLNLFDTFGPADPRNKLFSQLLGAVREGKPLDVSPGEQLLDLVYVDDVVEAFMQAGRLLEEGQVREGSYAVSSGRHLTLREVVSVFERVTGLQVPITWGGRPYRKREVMMPWTGEPLPGWTAQVPLEEGIRRTVEGSPEKEGASFGPGRGIGG